MSKQLPPSLDVQHTLSSHDHALCLQNNIYYRMDLELSSMCVLLVHTCIYVVCVYVCLCTVTHTHTHARTHARTQTVHAYIHERAHAYTQHIHTVLTHAYIQYTLTHAYM